MLIIFDIDGVVSTNGEISAEIKKAITNLKDKNISYTFASGRSYLRCIEIIKSIAPTIPLLLENGSKIIKSNGEILYSYPLNHTSLKYLGSILHLNIDNVKYSCFSSLNNLKYYFYTSRKFYYNLKNTIKYCSTITNNINTFIAYAIKNQCTQVTIEVKDRNSFIDTDFRFEKSEKSFLHLKEKRINKGSAILDLTKILSVPLSEIVVMGNDYNDVPMFSLNVAKKILVYEEKIDSALIPYATQLLKQNYIATFLNNL